MMLDELKDKWESISIGEKHIRRVNIKHPLTWHIGYDGSVNKALMFSAKQEFPALRESAVIGIRKTSDKRGWIQILSLKSGEYEDVFLHMCADLLEYSQLGADEQEAYRLLAARYKQWLDILKKGTNLLMSDEQQRGLLGELHFLAERLSEFPDDILTVVNGWDGPEGEPKDFYYGDEWFEIKTVKQGKPSVHISSLEQLDSADRGELVIYTLAQGGIDGKNSVNLNQAVDEVRELLHGDSDALVILQDKLLKAGYMPQEEYESKPFTITEENHYEVREDFPKLTKANVPKEISDVEYDLLIASLEAWKVEG